MKNVANNVYASMLPYGRTAHILTVASNQRKNNRRKLSKVMANLELIRSKWPEQRNES